MPSTSILDRLDADEAAGINLKKLPEARVRTPPLDDPKRFVCLDRLPLLNGSSTLAKITPALLKLLAENSNRRAEAGQYAIVLFGHTVPGRRETDQPAPKGYAKNFQLGRYNGEVCLMADLYVEVEHADEALSYPHRSVERWRSARPENNYVDSVSLLRVPADCDLGLLTRHARRRVHVGAASPYHRSRRPDGAVMVYHSRRFEPGKRGAVLTLGRVEPAYDPKKLGRWLTRHARFEEDKHPRADDGKFTDKDDDSFELDFGTPSSREAASDDDIDFGFTDDETEPASPPAKANVAQTRPLTPQREIFKEFKSEVLGRLAGETDTAAARKIVDRAFEWIKYHESLETGRGLTTLMRKHLHKAIQSHVARKDLERHARHRPPPGAFTVSYVEPAYDPVTDRWLVRHARQFEEGKHPRADDGKFSGKAGGGGGKKKKPAPGAQDAAKKKLAKTFREKFLGDLADTDDLDSAKEVVSRARAWVDHHEARTMDHDQATRMKYQLKQALKVVKARGSQWGISSR